MPAIRRQRRRLLLRPQQNRKEDQLIFPCPHRYGTAMQRLKEYLRIAVWWWGLGYVALWSTTLWALGDGAAMFSGSRYCKPDVAAVLFYWSCDAAQPIALLAAVVNGALTATVWAPVYVAAAVVRPEAWLIAGPILLVHAMGLPAALLVSIRVGLWLVRVGRGLFRRFPTLARLRSARV